jgi:ArsR family transcriptional regulator
MLTTLRPSSRNKVDTMFRAFSDRTRLRILNLLRGGERCVCDLVEVLGVPQPKASRHLAYLRKAGLVVARKQGQWSYYSLAPARGPFHGRLLACLATCFREVPELRSDADRLAACSSAARCCD